jgi:hypothetical protein
MAFVEQDDGDPLDPWQGSRRRDETRPVASAESVL